MSFPLQVSNARAATVAFVLAAVLGAAGAADAQGVPGTGENKCLAGKNKCVSQKMAGLLKCREQCEQKPDKCGQAQTDCEAKVIAKFDGGGDPTKGCFAKLEAKADPAKPESVCTTTGDTATVEAQADAAARDLVATLEGGAPAAWTCNPAFYDEADNYCDCGCGVVDPDCTEPTGASCRFCDDPGSCSLNCSQIDPTNNSRCRPDQCGNAVIDPGEECDQGVNGADCYTLGLSGSGLKCGAGCQFDTSACGPFDTCVANAEAACRAVAGTPACATCVNETGGINDPLYSLYCLNSFHNCAPNLFETRACAALLFLYGCAASCCQ